MLELRMIWNFFKINEKIWQTQRDQLLEAKVEHENISTIAAENMKAAEKKENPYSIRYIIVILAGFILIN